jgi:hypothetical protein
MSMPYFLANASVSKWRFLGALPVHKVELLELVIGQPTLECRKRNPRFRGCFASLRQPQSNKAAARFGQCG